MIVGFMAHSTEVQSFSANNKGEIFQFQNEHDGGWTQTSTLWI